MEVVLLLATFIKNKNKVELQGNQLSNIFLKDVTANEAVMGSQSIYVVRVRFLLNSCFECLDSVPKPLNNLTDSIFLHGSFISPLFLSLCFYIKFSCDVITFALGFLFNGSFWMGSGELVCILFSLALY